MIAPILCLSQDKLPVNSSEMMPRPRNGTHRTEKEKEKEKERGRLLHSFMNGTAEESPTNKPSLITIDRPNESSAHRFAQSTAGAQLLLLDFFLFFSFFFFFVCVK